MSTPHQLIISDLHLCTENADAVALFFKFIKTRAVQAEVLYILGDLFEFWIGDDAITTDQQKIIDALAQLAQANVKLYILHGNRDFLLGKRFCQMTGAILLPDCSIIKPYDQRILLLHGDVLCTDDKRYQRYRKFVHQAWVKTLFCALPIAWRQKIAHKLRTSNQYHYVDTRPINQGDIADVNTTSVTATFDKHAVDTMIHGHTHRFAIHYDDHKRQRIVLGDWHHYGSFVSISPQGISLHAF